MPGQDYGPAEFEREMAGMDREQQAIEQYQEATERQLQAKVAEAAQNLKAAEEIKQWQVRSDEQPDPETEREAEVHRLKANALGVIGDYNLHGLHERQEAKLADLHGLREQQAEQSRHLRQLTLNADTAKLDALAEMESQPGYVPGKNEEQRRRQRDSWLANHGEYRSAQRVVQSAEAVQEHLELKEHRVQDELSSLKSLISIRIAEMRLISSFVGR